MKLLHHSYSTNGVRPSAPLAVPHSGTWTEGMMADDEAVYLRVRKLRDAWRREEAMNIADYLEHQKTASSPPVTLPSRLTLSR